MHSPDLGPPPRSDGLQALALAAASSSASTSAASSSAPATPASASRTAATLRNGDAAGAGAGAAAAAASPNHPSNLRKAARAELDSSFSVKSYIGAANALLEKAEAADRQGSIEQAFVNYLKSANVASFIPKHAEWPKILQTRAPAYSRYQDFMGRVPDIIARTHRLEAQLKAREEAREEAQASAAAASSDNEATLQHRDSAASTADGKVDSLADRLEALRTQSSSSSSLANAKRMSAAVQSSGKDLASTAALPTLDEGDAGPSSWRRHSTSSHVVSPSEFASAYPPLDEFEATAVAQPPPRPLPPPPPPPMPGVASTQQRRALPSAPAPQQPTAAARGGADDDDLTPLPLTNHVTVEELWSLLNPGYKTVAVETSTGEKENRMVKRTGRKVLLLDVRGRERYEERHIKGESVCIDTKLVQPGMSANDIAKALNSASAPSSELALFEARDQYELVVIYDQASRTLAPPPAGVPGVIADMAEAHARLDAVFRAIYEREFYKPLRQQPVLLIGGLDSWSRKVGPPGLQGTHAGAPDAASSPDLRQAPSSSTRDDDAKRLRRQAVVLPDGGISAGQRYAVPPTLPTPSFAPPSLPARAYQSPNAGGAPPPGAPSFPPVAASASSRSREHHTSQPSIPYSGGGGQSNATPGFDYPRLRSVTNGADPQHHVTPPPLAAASNGVTSAARHAHSASLSGTSRAPGTGASLDLARRSVPPPARSASYSALTPAPSSRGANSNNVRIGLTGLKNVGNSCYMNATLQCLSATVPLARFLLDGSYKRAINRTNPLGTQGALAEAFAQLIRVMWSESYTFVSPVTFRDAITRFAPAFRGYDQHDAQEFLAFLLDGLHEDLNHVVNKPPPVDMTPAREQELEMLPQQVASVKEWAIYRQRNDSLVVDWFQGQFRNKLTCCTCGKTSTTYNAFMYLSLPIPASRNARVTLLECVDAFVREEVMDKADAWHCPSCKKPRKAIKRLTISRLPQVLFVHLKRFAFRAGTDKVQTTVEFPINDTLDLTNHMPPHAGFLPKNAPVSQSQQPPYLYQLTGVVHHFGTLNTGHYTASIRSQGDWYYADDSRVTKTSDTRQLQSGSPYILCYSRI